jgi:ribosomal protein L29
VYQGINMGTTYETDIIAWANEQAELLRSGHLSDIDIENIAEEILDVGKSEQRELASRMAVLLAHLLKWQYQPALRGASWRATIRAQRKEIALALKETPSLKPRLSNEEWLSVNWAKAVAQAITETGLDSFPENCPWTVEETLSESWLPN